MSIFEKLANIQQELIAPKSQRNNFGKFNYRSCEDIEAAVKPLLKKYKATVIMDGGKMEMLGDRYYMTCKVVFVDLETGEQYFTTATVREGDGRNGMSEEQASGAEISYCRKYCLAGLFLIDNEKDADTDEHTERRKNAAEVEEMGKKKIDDNKVKALLNRCIKDGVDENKLLAMHKVTDPHDITETQFYSLNANWEKVIEKCPITKES